ncbi:MAG: Yop proteins translocation protein L [Chlamydiales bacterium]|nr:Yop proteins translocation protein L [Chlamydiales bacterium]
MKFFDLIEEDHIHIAPDTKVIPAKQFAKLKTVTEIIRQTKKEAVRYRTAVASECEILKEEADRAGFEQGLHQWSEQLFFLKKEIENVRKEIENSIVPLALTAVKKIVGRELETHPETIVDIVSTALKTVSQHRKISIYVHPSEQELVEKKRSEIKQLFDHLESLSIVAREDVQPGGCIIETEAGIINAQLENQLQALKAAFKSFLQHEGSG